MRMNFPIGVFIFIILRAKVYADARTVDYVLQGAARPALWIAASISPSPLFGLLKFSGARRTSKAQSEQSPPALLLPAASALLE